MSNPCFSGERLAENDEYVSIIAVIQSVSLLNSMGLPIDIKYRVRSGYHQKQENHLGYEVVLHVHYKTLTLR